MVASLRLHGWQLTRGARHCLPCPEGMHQCAESVLMLEEGFWVTSGRHALSQVHPLASSSSQGKLKDSGEGHGSMGGQAQ